MKLLFFACAVVSPLLSMDYVDHIHDARTLAQGHSTDGWVNYNKVAQIAQALETIKQEHKHLADIHVDQKDFSAEISLPKGPDLENLENQVQAITEEFDGRQERHNLWCLEDEPTQTIIAKFDNYVDIKALIDMYKKIPHVTATLNEAISFYPTADISLTEHENIFEFKFKRNSGNCMSGAEHSKIFTVAYDTKTHTTSNYRESAFGKPGNAGSIN